MHLSVFAIQKLRRTNRGIFWRQAIISVFTSTQLSVALLFCLNLLSRAGGLASALTHLGGAVTGPRAQRPQIAALTMTGVLLAVLDASTWRTGFCVLASLHGRVCISMMTCLLQRREKFLDLHGLGQKSPFVPWSSQFTLYRFSHALRHASVQWDRICSAQARYSVADTMTTIYHRSRISSNSLTPAVGALQVLQPVAPPPSSPLSSAPPSPHLCRKIRRPGQSPLVWSIARSRTRKTEFHWCKVKLKKRLQSAT